MREMLPAVPSSERVFAMDVVMTAMSAIGKTVSEEGYSRAEVDRLAAATGDMFCAYLERLTGGSALPTASPRRNASEKPQ